MRCRLIALLIAGGLSLPGLVSAQETLPAPAADPAPPAAQPVPRQPAPAAQSERTPPGVRIFGFGRQFIQNFAGPVPGAPEVAPLVPERLNARFVEIAEPVLAAQPDIESISFVIDPNASNLERDRLAATATVRLRRTAWSDQPSGLGIGLAAYMDRSEAVPAGRLEVNGRLRTDVVPLSRFVIERLKLALPTEAGPNADSSELFRARLRVLLEEHQEVNSLDDLTDLFLNIAAARLQAANDVVERLKQQYDLEPRPQVKEELARELFEARRARERLLTTKTNINRDDRDFVTSLSLHIVEPYVGALLEVPMLDIVLYEDRAEVKVKANAVNSGPLYFLAKPVVMGTLRSLQEGDPAAVQTAEQLLQRGVERGKAEVIAPPAPDEAPLVAPPALPSAPVAPEAPAAPAAPKVPPLSAPPAPEANP